MLRHRIAFCLIVLHACTGYTEPLFLTHGTLIDVSHGGEYSRDIEDATVVIEGDRISKVGTNSEISVPPHAKVLDLRGTYLVPGLIDGFGTVKTQGFANAYLYNGVTTISTISGDSRRGYSVFHGSPTPRLLSAEIVNGYPNQDGNFDGSYEKARLEASRLSKEQLTRRLEEVANSGTQTILIHYATWPDQVDWIVHEARRLGLSTFGELGWTSYAYGARAGIQVFIHSKRYFSSLAPDDPYQSYGDDPFGPNAKPALDYVTSLSSTSKEVDHLATMFTRDGTAVMPNIAMHYSAAGTPLRNPWLAPSAALIKPEELHRPIDPMTGRPHLLPNEMHDDQRHRLAYLQEQFKAYDAKNVRLREMGVRFLAASGASAFGVLPGSGQIDEIVAMQNLLGMIAAPSVGKCNQQLC